MINHHSGKQGPLSPVIFCVFILLLLFSRPLFSESSHESDPLTIKIVTVGPGDALYLWWGHTAIIVEDTVNETEKFYDYGVFTFEAENFVRNFAFGRLLYSVAETDPRLNLTYQLRQNRNIRIQTLNLPHEAKIFIKEFLQENVLPGNDIYLYHHFDDNCSTRVRDVLNKALHGQLYEATSIPSPLTLRQHTRKFTSRHFFMDWLLMFIINNQADKPILVWDAMFLPLNLERVLSDFTYINPAGERVPLVAEEEVYFQAKDRAPPVKEYRPHWPLGLIGGLMLLLLSSALYLFARRFYLLFGTLFGLFSGIIGSVLFFMSTFTDHTITYWNQNLLLTNPVTLIAGVFYLLGFIKGQPVKRTAQLWNFLCIMAFLSIVIKVIPSIYQHNWLSISILLPPLLSLSGIWQGVLKKCPLETAGFCKKLRD